MAHEFIILDVQEDQLRPQVSFFRGLDDLRNVDASNEQFEMFHH
jgi:hypothetical protein